MHHHHHNSNNQHVHGRKRGRTASPPLRHTSHRPIGRSPPLSPRTSTHETPEAMHYDPTLAALLQDRSFYAQNRAGALLYDDAAVAGTTEYARVRALHDVLQRTSLTEFRDREIAEWLQEIELWLQQSATSSSSSSYSAAAVGGVSNVASGRSSAILGAASATSASAAAAGARGGGGGAMSAEVRFVILGVLDTLPWWRLVEGFANDAQSHAASASTAVAVDPTRAAAAATAGMRKVPHSFVRWHEKIQISFERVCLALIDQSPRAVQGVLEVLMRPFHVRPPVRDGAERSLPCDSVIRVLSHVAARYPPLFVLDTLEQSMGTLLPKQRWPDRRHHVACVAVLLHLALEAYVPIYHPQLGNQQSFAEARERFFVSSRPAHRRHRDRHGSRSEDGGGDGSDPFRLPAHTGPTSEESSTDASTTTTTSTIAPFSHRRDAATALQIPSGYRSASGLFVESGIRLPPRSLAGFLSTAHDGGATGESSAGVFSSDAEEPVHVAGAPPVTATNSSNNNNNATPTAEGAVTTTTTPRLAADNPNNNKMLAYRNEIIRCVLRHLMTMELTLERTTEATAMDEQYWLSSRPGSPHTRRRGSSTVWSPTTMRAAPGHSAMTSGRGDRVAAEGFPSFPSSPAPSPHQTITRATGMLTEEALSRGGDGAALRASPTVTHDAKSAAQACTQLAAQFIASAKPFFRILLDCTRLVFGKLSADLARQQAAGACGNADWWRELMVFHTHATLRTEHPVCLLYLAPSLALRGVGGEAADLLHKIISVVIKGVVPPQLQQATRGGGGGGGASRALQGGGMGAGPGAMGSGSSAAGTGGAGAGGAGAQPVRMRMAPPSAGGGMHLIPLDQRLRAAQFVFPLFRFLRSRLGGEEEGLRRRLLKWMAQEMRKAGHASGVARGGGGVGAAPRRGALAESTSSATMQLVEVVFAQCAAISELLDLDMVSAPASDSAASQTSNTATTTTTTTTTGSESGVDAVTEALQPLLAKYTLHSALPQASELHSPDDERGVSASATPPAARQLHLDLHQLELEGLLKPNLMSFCPWPLTENP